MAINLRTIFVTVLCAAIVAVLLGVIVLLLAMPCSAADDFQGTKPDKPQPQPRAADRIYWAEVGAMAGAWTADAVTTHQMIVSAPYRHETGPLFTGSRSTAKIMGAWAAVDLGAAVAAYEWKRHIHNRYLHPLWHVFLLERIEGHTQAAIQNATLPAPLVPVTCIEGAGCH